MKPNGFRTILVVEDDEAVRKFSLLVLRTHGYRTLESFDGVGGLETFFRHKDEVDLVLTDLVMPHSGSEMVEEMLRLEPTVKVVFMTGTHSELPRHLKDIPTIEKPFTARQLADFVREHLRGPDEGRFRRQSITECNKLMLTITRLLRCQIFE